MSILNIEEIYNRHVKTVYRVCFTYMKSSADAEDATADTFVRMIKSSPDFQDAEHEKAWLIRTASNVCKDLLKHSWRKRENLDDHASYLKVEHSFEADDVAEAVFSLPDKYKAIIYLYYFEGYTSVEISEMLKKPQSTVRSRLQAAKKILKERLGAHYE